MTQREENPVKLNLIGTVLAHPDHRVARPFEIIISAQCFSMKTCSSPAMKSLKLDAFIKWVRESRTLRSWSPSVEGKRLQRTERMLHKMHA